MRVALTSVIRRWLAVVVALAVAAALTVVPSPRAGAVAFVDVIVVLDTQPPDPAASVSATTRAVRSAALAQAAGVGGEVTNVYSSVFDGYSARIPETALAALEANPAVVWVERDQEVSIAAQDTPTGVDRIFATDNAAIDIDSTDDWRVDVDVAVLDTGIDASHPDLDVVSAINCLNVSSVSNCSTSGTADLDGHGTHVAGTIGALDNDFGVVGVAPGARLWNVRVLDETGSGSLSGVIAGMDWVTARADQIEVLNMSLSCGGCVSAAFETAVTNSVEAGVVVVVAAGNANTDAANTIPSRYADAISVSAIADYDGLPGGLASTTCTNFGSDDRRASFSNYGTVVDITAPGVCIRSTWPVADGAYNTISGTSMASPAVAGAAALLASGDNDPTNRADVEAIRAALLSTGNSNWTDNSGDGVKEPLLDVSGASFAPALIEGSDPSVAPGFLRVTTSPAVASQIVVDGVARDTWGLTWVKLDPGDYDVAFADVAGFSAPEPQTVTILEGQTTEVVGEFVERGWLRVSTSPALPGTISVDGAPRNDWGLWTDFEPGSYELCYGEVEGFTSPDCETVEVVGGALNEIVATYTEDGSTASLEPHGLLRLTTSPAVPSQVFIDGVARDTWGLNWMKLPPGTYEVSFGDVPGFGTPQPRTVTIVAGETTTTTGVFDPRGWLRVLTSPGVSATISVDGVPRNDWGVWTDLAVGSHEVCFGEVDGLTAPPCVTRTLVAGELTTVTGAYS